MTTRFRPGEPPDYTFPQFATAVPHAISTLRHRPLARPHRAHGPWRAVRAVGVLERAGAPAGSRMLEGPDVLREFGRYESLAVYLDGISLPDDVHASLDFDQVVKDF